MNAAGFVIDYNTRLFESKLISRLGNSITAVLTSIQFQPGKKMSALDIVSAAERTEILENFNRPVMQQHPGSNLNDLFRSAASKYEKLPAISYGDTTLSYAVLDELSDDHAFFLSSAGIAKADRVGLSMTPGIEMIAWLLAIIKTGGVVVPVDITLPPPRLKMMIEDAALKCIITTSGNPVKQILEGNYWFIDIDNIADQPAKLSAGWPVMEMEQQDGLYILFTSGSTGRPKAVFMTHGPVCNLISWQAKCYTGIAPKTLQRTSIAFDVSFQEIFSTICFGGHLVIADENIRMDISQMCDFLRSEDIERTFLPVVSLKQLAEIHNIKSFVFKSLKEIICAGEQLKINASIIRFFRDNQCALENQYGPTEAHVVSAYRMEESSIRWPELPPIGKPVDNTRIYILDAWDKLVPVGVYGELYIGGMQLANGYIGNDALTNKAFINDPFAKDTNARMYRTGDFGRYREDGNIEFLGRKDSQVKIRGYRVELAEIELALSAIPEIEDAVVTTFVPGSEQELKLLAYFTTKQKLSASVKSIRQSLAQRLPGYMLPDIASFIHLKEFPVNSNGKIDRVNLPSPESLHAGKSHIDLPSRSEVENVVASIWSGVLGIQNIQGHESFSEIGGHSLLAIQIVSRVNELFGIVVPLRVILGSGTIVTMANAIEDLLLAKIEKMTDTEVQDKLSELTREDPAMNPSVQQVNRQRKITLPNGMEVADSYRPETIHLYKDIFKHHTYCKDFIEYKPGAVIVDAGANIGLFSLYAYEKSPGAQLYAFEPVPQLFQLLEENTRNLKPSPRLYNMALSDKEGSRELTYYPLLPGMSTFYPNEKEERDLLKIIFSNQAEVERQDETFLSLEPFSDEVLTQRISGHQVMCKSVTLSSFLTSHEIPYIDLLKIDVQKSELDILHGIAAEHWPLIKQVVIEVHNKHNRLDDIVALLKAQQFETRIVQDSIHTGSIIYFVYAKRNT